MRDLDHKMDNFKAAGGMVVVLAPFFAQCLSGATQWLRIDPIRYKMRC